jgi:hypothetical protein
LAIFGPLGLAESVCVAVIEQEAHPFEDHGIHTLELRDVDTPTTQVHPVRFQLGHLKSLGWKGVVNPSDWSGCTRI